MFYGDEERGALTLHFESSDQTRLFGSPAFIYLPTAAWLDYYWSKVRTVCGPLPDPHSTPVVAARTTLSAQTSRRARGDQPTGNWSRLNVRRRHILRKKILIFSKCN